MLAQIAKEPRFHNDWLYELKLDGIRCIAYLGSETRLQARSGADITSLFPELQQMHRQAGKPCILDGEIICASFHAIQRRVHKQKALDIKIAQKFYPARYFAFDALKVSGENTMTLPQVERKETLGSVFTPGEQGLILPSQVGRGAELLNYTREHRLEGVMAKSPTALYLEGKRSFAWLKMKNFQEGTFYICGLTEGENSREDTFGSLILGELVGDKLLYVGNVGSGFNQQQLKILLGVFRTVQGECPFRQISVDKPVKFWTKPIAQCEVRYLERSNDGKLRFPTFRRIV